MQKISRMGFYFTHNSEPFPGNNFPEIAHYVFSNRIGESFKR